jgi:hypothetical protein
MPQTLQAINVYFPEDSSRFWNHYVGFCATKEIAKGEELLWDYGNKKYSKVRKTFAFCLF